MATGAQTIGFIKDQLASLGPVHALPMFGEFGLYCETKLFALVCGDQLFLKITPATTGAGLPEAPPYPGAKPYYAVPEDMLEEPEQLVSVIRQTLDALPLPKKAPKRLQNLP